MSVGDAAALESPMWRPAPRGLVWLMGMFGIRLPPFHHTDRFWLQVPFLFRLSLPSLHLLVYSRRIKLWIQNIVFDSKSEPLILTFRSEKGDLSANTSAEVTQVGRVSSSTAAVAIIPVRDILQAGYNAKTELFAFKTHWAPVIITIVTGELEP